MKNKLAVATRVNLVGRLANGIRVGQRVKVCKETEPLGHVLLFVEILFLRLVGRQCGRTGTRHGKVAEQTVGI